MADNDREHRIREHAYRWWEAEGRPEGRHEHHWGQASQQVGDEMFQQQGSTDSQERRGSLDGGLLPQGGLVAGGGPASSGVGGIGMTGEDADDTMRQQQGDTGGAGGQMGGDTGGASGLSTGLQPGGTIPGGGPGAGMGSIGTGGGSTGGEATGTLGRREE
jgi:hypothetical protein